MTSILYTRFDGGVSICFPSEECLQWLSSGGYWNGRAPGFADDQIERQIRDGIRPHAATRFVRAMQEGGCTTAEALEIIRDRDCGHLGSAHELIGSYVNRDRWFRNAWRRSHNGGPIYVDMNAARAIQWKRISASAKKAKVELKTGWRARIRRAESPEHLKSIWPRGLSIG